MIEFINTSNSFVVYYALGYGSPSKKFGAPSSFKYKNKYDSMNPQKFPSKNKKNINIIICGIFIMFTRSCKRLSAGSLAPRGITATVMADIRSKTSYV